ncbi:MAG: hypothetical protein R2881_08045 [Eubacteriales bacterium]
MPALRNRTAEAQANGTYYTGDKLYNNSSIDGITFVYVDGRITVAGSTFTGVGMLVARAISSSTAVALSNRPRRRSASIPRTAISRSTLQHQHRRCADAPNGQIQVNGSNVVINGRVIGKEVQLNGSYITINATSGDTAFLPGEIIRLVEYRFPNMNQTNPCGRMPVKGFR